jgi:hypothetical protein
MTEPTDTQEAEQFESTGDHRHSHCGPWGMHPKMWMYSRMVGGRGFRGPGGPWRGRSSRAQRWLYENPTDEQIVEFLEEYQRDLEQQIEDVRTRIEDIKSRNAH